MENKEIAILGSCGAVVTYVPFRTEVAFRDVIPLPADALIYEIQPRAALDPIKEAEVAMNATLGQKTAILIPGRKFDALGTRFGQGGGWYDRFLSQVPVEWIRIGFCFSYQFSEETLKREPWDQVMDFVCVVDKESGSLAIHETHARKI